MCVSADLPSEPEASYIGEFLTGNRERQPLFENCLSLAVEIAPKAIAGKYYHIIITACDEPGYRDPSGKSSVWDCGNSANIPMAGLPRGRQCASTDAPEGSFRYQFQGGNLDEGALRLPAGTGIPVGGRTGTKSLVFEFHFPDLNRTLDHMSGETEVDVRLIHSRPGIKSASSFAMAGYGFVGAKSVGSVSAVWTLRRDFHLHPTAIYTHNHFQGIGVQVLIERTNGERELIHERDPRVFKGMTTLDPEPEAMTLGDRLVLECTYNNTMATDLRVW